MPKIRKHHIPRIRDAFETLQAHLVSTRNAKSTPSLISTPVLRFISCTHTSAALVAWSADANSTVDLDMIPSVAAAQYILFDHTLDRHAYHGSYSLACPSIGCGSTHGWNSVDVSCLLSCWSNFGYAVVCPCQDIGSRCRMHVLHQGSSREE